MTQPRKGGQTAVQTGSAGAGPDPQSVQKRSVTIAGHRTSISLEAVFWTALRDIAAARGQSVNALVTDIDRERWGNLSSAIRVFVLREIAGGSVPRPADG